MKKLAALVLLLTLPALACSSSWVNQVEQNPAEVVLQIAQVVQDVVTTAQLVFGAVKGTLPAATQASDQALLDNAIAVVEHSLTVLEDAVQAAIDAKTTTIANLGPLETDVQNAVDALIATIDTIRGVPVGGADAGAPLAASGPGAASYQDLKVQQNLLKRIH